MKVIYSNMDAGKTLNVWVYDEDCDKRVFVCNLNVVKKRFGYFINVNNPKEKEKNKK